MHVSSRDTQNSRADVQHSAGRGRAPATQEQHAVVMIVLFCATGAALAGGVLLAYALCFGMFQVFRIHSMQVAQQRVAAKHVAGAKLIAG